MNGDGYADIIIGAPYYDSGQRDEGRAFIYLGSETGPGTPAWMAESDQSDAKFGIAVGSAGDVNGDGYADVIVGAAEYDQTQVDEGKAFVYHGSAAGVATSPAWTARGAQAGAELGRSVGTAGDVNGDGYADAIIGMPEYDNPQKNEGLVLIFLGSPAGLKDWWAADWMVDGQQVGAGLGKAVGQEGDVNGDGYAEDRKSVV